MSVDLITCLKPKVQLMMDSLVTVWYTNGIIHSFVEHVILFI